MADMSWLAGEYADRKAAAEARVSRWEGCSGPAFEAEPLYGLRHRFAAGEPLGTTDGAPYVHGLDTEGRAWVERRATTPGGPLRRLNTLDWPSLLPVPDDFFVFATDIEEEDLDDALREAVGEERAARLRTAIQT